MYSVSCGARVFFFSGSLVIVVVCYKALQLVTVTEVLNCT